MEKRLFRATRTITSYEEVEVFASHYAEARELIEDDDISVNIISGREGDYEISGSIEEVKE